MYQLLFFTDLWKQLLECFFVLRETLKRDETEKNKQQKTSLRLGIRNVKVPGGLTVFVPVLSVFSKPVRSLNVCDLLDTHKIKTAVSLKTEEAKFRRLFGCESTEEPSL